MSLMSMTQVMHVHTLMHFNTAYVGFKNNNNMYLYHTFNCSLELNNSIIRIRGTNLLQQITYCSKTLHDSGVPLLGAKHLNPRYSIPRFHLDSTALFNFIQN